MTYSKKRTLSYGVILISVLLAYFCRQVRTENVFMRNLADQYDGDVKIIPIFKVATRTGLDQFGISQSTYQELTGNQCSLREDEILAYREDNMQKEEETNKKEIRIHYEYIHMGKFRGGIYESRCLSGF